MIGSTLADVGVTPGTEPIEQEAIMSVYAGLSPEAFPLMTLVMGTADATQFDSERQFEDLLDAYVRGLELRRAERSPEREPA